MKPFKMFLKENDEILHQVHVRKIKQFGDLEVWLVRGWFIRKNLDINFTNFGNPLHYKCIPKNELWIDEEAANDEIKFYIEHLLSEYRFMQRGIPYSKAYDMADAVELKYRRRHDTKYVNPLMTPEQVKIKKLLTLRNQVAVFLVNGEMVRDNYDLDYAEGGHDVVYKWIPEREVWLDNDIFQPDIGPTLLHEIHERRLMAEAGWSYDLAHEYALKVEMISRQHPDRLLKLLQDDYFPLDTKIPRF